MKKKTILSNHLKLNDKKKESIKNFLNASKSFATTNTNNTNTCFSSSSGYSYNGICLLTGLFLHL